MTDYAILRFAKLKNWGQIGGSLSHNYRTRDTPNADSDLTHLNEHSHETTQDVKNDIKNRLPEKYRKDAVMCLEHLITASPDWHGWGTEKEAEFFEQSKKWLEDRYGKENVIATSIHRDETTPHLVAYVVPLDDQTGRLNAKKWTSGNIALSKMQTNFAERVKHLGLHRGIENSQAEHIKLQTYHASVNRTLKQLDEISLNKIPKPEAAWKFESKEEYAQKVLDAVIPNYETAVIQANQVNANKRELYKLRKKVELAKPYLNAVSDLPIEYKNALDQKIKIESDRLNQAYERQKAQELENYESLKHDYYEFESYVNECLAERNSTQNNLDNRLSKTEKWLNKSKTTEQEYEEEKRKLGGYATESPDYYITYYQYENWYEKASKDCKLKIAHEADAKNIERVVFSLKELSTEKNVINDLSDFDKYVQPVISEFKLESRQQAEQRVQQQQTEQRRSAQRAENERIQKEALEKYQNDMKLESERNRAVLKHSNNEPEKKIDRGNDLSM